MFRNITWSSQIPLVASINKIPIEFLRSILVRSGILNRKTIYRESREGYGSLEKITNIMISHGGYILIRGLDYPDDLYVVIIFDNHFSYISFYNQSMHIFIEGFNKIFIDNIIQEIEKELTPKPPKGCVMMLATDNGSLYLTELGEINAPLERHNYTDKVCQQYDNVINELKSDNPGGRLTILDGPPGTGKAQPLSSAVLTPNGFVPMGSLNVGDTVSTPNGGTTTISHIFPQGFMSVYEVLFSDGSRTECTLNHLWNTTTKNERESKNRERKKGTVKTLSEIKDSLYIENGKRRNHSIPQTKPVFFALQSLPISPYLLGVLLGDGGFRGYTPGFTTQDREIVESVSSLIPDECCVSTLKDGLQYSISSKEWKLTRSKTSYNPIKEFLKELGLWGLSSKEKFIPYKYLHSSVEDRIELLRGLMDTDGSCDKRGYSQEYGTSSKELADDFCFLVRSLGGITTLKYRPKTNSYRIHIRLNINPFHLSRKKDLWKPKTKYFPKRFITSIEYSREDECQCIKLADTDNLYITDDFIVTHNSFFIRGLVTEAEALYVYIPATLTASITGPDVLPVFLRARQRNLPIVLIMEDADATIATRQIDNVGQLSDLLNMSDGILGEMADIRILATTNQKKSDIDAATLRVGRINEHIGFSYLNDTHACEIFSRLTNIKDPDHDAIRIINDVTEKNTLASIYNLARRHGWEPQKRIKSDQKSYRGYRNFPIEDL